MADTRSQCIKAVEEASSIVHELLLEGDDKWKVSKTSSAGTVYYTKSPSISGHIFKVVFEVDIGMERAIQCIYPAPKGFRQEWDPNLQRSEILEDIDEDTYVMLSLTKPAFSGIIAAREFIDVVRLKKVSNKCTIATGISVEYPSIPVKKDIVRGFNYPCGTLWEVLEGHHHYNYHYTIQLILAPCTFNHILQITNKVRVSVMYHSDIGGRVPRRIVETALPSAMMSDVEALFAHLKNEAK